MMVDRRCKYHIRLIRRRWRKEALQEHLHIDPSDEPFVFADTLKQDLEDADRTPVPEDFMNDILAAFASCQSVPRPEAKLISKKRRYGELTGLSKEIAERISSDPKKFERIKNLLTKELADLRDVEEIRDPAYVIGKGRPRVKRLKSAAEPKKDYGRGSRCGKCGMRGHNTRTCLS